MKDVRIGNDISVIWSLYSDQKPFPLEGLKLSVYLKGMYGKTKIEDYTIKDNEIHWTFFGKDQKHTGKYSLTLVVNEGAEGMVTTDVCDLVRLVSCTCQADGSDEEGVQTETIAVNSEVELLSGGFGRIDTALDPMSENAVSNATITAEFAKVNEATSGLKTQMADDKAELMTNLEQVGVLAYEAAMRSSRNEQDKVSKEEGKGLSSNDYTDEDKTKLEGLDNYDDSEVKQSIKEVRESIANINPAPMVSVTYSELVELRDNGELIAGMQYRITDYVTTTAQENTRSAGHPFDVIVTADSAYKLNEVARACLHEGDDYFLNEASKLEAWKIWYCLDNDSKRFAWSVDFGIKRDGRTYVWSGTDDDNNGYILYPWVCVNDSGMVLYTKTLLPQKGETCYDDTGVEDGVIEDIIKGKGVIYRMIDEFGNDCPYDFKNVMFKRNLNFDNGYAEFSEDGEETWVYTFAGQSYHIDNDEWSGMLDGSLESPFGHQSDDRCSTFHSNIIKPYIMFWDDINEDRTKAGIRYLNDNVFLGYWEEIGSTNEEDVPYYYPRCCFSNRLGNNCFSNSFNRECFFNSFGNDCHSITFGNYCSSNTFGSSCSYNTFGNYCSYNTFGIGCHFNSFNDSSGRASKVRGTILENGVSDVTFRINKQSGAYGYIQYYHVYMGVQNTTVNMYDNNKYEMGVACDQQGNVHTFCIMDFKNS